MSGILTEEELKERNRLLVLENDELNAENMKLKKRLDTAVKANVLFSQGSSSQISRNHELLAENEKFKNAMVEVYCRSLGLNFSVSSYANYILEECGYDTSELPIE